MKRSMLTCFASPGRSSQEEILQQYRVIADDADMVAMLNSVASLLTVLNINRQVVYTNQTVLNLLGATDIHQVLGKRVGELFGCQHAFAVNGCGTSQHCKACGAVQTMLSCVMEKPWVEECSITNDDTNVTFDLRVHCSLINVKSNNFIFCSIFDISNEKRRGVMERIFFHDLMNTINGLNGISYALDKVDVSEYPMYMSYLAILINSLTEQIKSHRVLTMAEKDEYKPEQHTLTALDMVNEEVQKYRQQAAMETKKITVVDYSGNQSFVSDKILLSRILGNMIKNALEAEPSGSEINVGIFKDVDGSLIFRVHNECIMSENERLQVFNRSFSTKGSNRGLGTYSMKLLSEKYLNGTVSFVSNYSEGTVFTVKIPI